ncbi:cytochrome P450 [Terricaulis sp.]|uniref:cytochrome P450 n=1 Tax=Terricaulis sp. TaxID=2768686 RepID=UPI0037843403
MSDPHFDDFDIHKPGAREEAESVWTLLRDAPGLAHCKRYGGFHIAARYADMKAALMNHGLFASGAGITLPPATTRSRHIPAETDQPLHKEYRGVMQRTLMPDRISPLEPAVRDIVIELLDAFKSERIDLFSAFARPLPVYVMLHFLGLPRKDGPMIDKLVEDLHEEVASGLPRGAGPKLTSYAEDVIRNRTPSGDDFVSTVLRGEVDGRPLSFDEQANMVRQVLIGAFDTTSLTLAAAVWWLAQHPADAQRLRGEPGIMNAATEEMVRFASASTYLRRTVTADAVFAGTQLREGDYVLLAFGAANRDPTVFPEPDTLVLDRKPNLHLGFGMGVHRCIGSHLAKLQLRVALEELLKRYDLALDGGEAIAFSTGLGQGIVKLPLNLSRRAG